eukprot:scaffold116164_cov71-Phaeocystis_antarctica.AAC.1
MHVSLRGRILRSLSANSRPADRSATFGSPARSAPPRRASRRPVRSAAAARRSARVEQRQDGVMTPAGSTDTTSAPSKASSAPDRSARGSACEARPSRPRATALEEGGEEARAEQLAAAGSRELEASRRALATLAGRTARIVSEVSACQIVCAR